jgi:hypothetical protein
MHSQNAPVLIENRRHSIHFESDILVAVTLILITIWWLEKLGKDSQ